MFYLSLEDADLLYNNVIHPDAGPWSRKQREQLRDPREITKLPYRTGTACFDGCYHHVYIIPSAGGTPKRLVNSSHLHRKA